MVHLLGLKCIKTRFIRYFLVQMSLYHCGLPVISYCSVITNNDGFPVVCHGVHCNTVKSNNDGYPVVCHGVHCNTVKSNNDGFPMVCNGVQCNTVKSINDGIPVVYPPFCKTGIPKEIRETTCIRC